MGRLLMILVIMLFLNHQACGQKVNGTVSNKETGKFLIAVNISVKGTTMGTITDSTGHYDLNVPSMQDTLVFSYIGYQKRMVPIKGRNTINIKLKPKSLSGNQMVVTGYGKQEKKTVTGAISSINTAQLQQSPVANVTNALAGRLPGLFANQFRGGEPGVSSSSLRIRGVSTYNAGKSPIVIVDGVQRNFQYIDPDEIKSITILKDASATAAYGIRGANGVIVVTTKRGIISKPKVTFNVSHGINKPNHFPKYLGSYQYAKLYNEAVMNDNPTADPSTLNLFSQKAFKGFKNGRGYSHDYYKYIFKRGRQNKYNFTVRGGNKRIRYYVFANLFRQDGNYTHSNLTQYNTQDVFNRYNFRSNVDINITKGFSAKIDLGARVTHRNATGATATRLTALANTLPPYFPIVLNNNGNKANKKFESKNPTGLLFATPTRRLNILGELSRTGYQTQKHSYFNGQFSLDYKLGTINNALKGLKANLKFAYDSQSGQTVLRTVGGYTEGYKHFPGYATFRPKAGADVYMNPNSAGNYQGAYVSANKYIQDQHIGNSFQQYPEVGRKYYQLKLHYDRHFGVNHVTAMILGNRSNKVINNEPSYVYQGINSRVQYQYDDRYLFEFDMGYNGSQNFAPGHRYGFFPAYSAGWVISNEKFMSGIDWLDRLKIRGSYGKVGNDDVPGPRFPYLQFYVGGTDYFFGSNNFSTSGGGGLKEGPLANTSLSWATENKTDFGIDATLFNNRLSVTADIFYDHRYNIISNLSAGDILSLPDIVGKGSPIVNLGVVNNKGLDFSIKWDGHIGNSLIYHIKSNFSYAHNTIKNENEIHYKDSYRAATGHPIGTHTDFIFSHFVRNQQEARKLNNSNNGEGYQPWGKLQPGDVVYKDLNHDGNITDLEDRKATGYPRSPEIQFGIPMGFQYKDIDFSVLFQGATHTSLQLGSGAAYDFPLLSNDKIGKVKPMHLNRWTPQTKNTATYPRLSIGRNDNNKNPNSSLFLYSAQYIRLKTIEIGYQLPQNVIGNTGLNMVRIYIQGLNLFTWDNLGKVDVDPETQQGPGNWYPIQKVVNSGIRIKF